MIRRYLTPMVSEDEYDALTREARRWYRWRPGRLRAVKRGYRRRNRRAVRLLVASGGDAT